MKQTTQFSTISRRRALAMLGAAGAAVFAGVKLLRIVLSVSFWSMLRTIDQFLGFGGMQQHPRRIAQKEWSDRKSVV